MVIGPKLPIWLHPWYQNALQGGTAENIQSVLSPSP